MIFSAFTAKYFYGKTPEETAKALVKDGWITCSLQQYEEIYYHYKQSHSMQETADHFGKSKADVHKIVHRLG